MTTLAAVQRPPVFFDRAASVERAADLVREAGDRADLVVFPESYVPGYPAYYTGGLDNPADELADYLLALQASAVRLPDDIAPVREAAAETGAVVVLGCTERDDRPGSETCYNTNVVVGADGEIRHRHRKLVPTYTERVYWGRGDGRSLEAVETAVGRLGTLVCWENHMTLARAALIGAGETVHACNWPGSWGAGEDAYLGAERSTDCDAFPAVRAHAFEAGAHVVSAAAVLSPGDLPDEWTHLPDSPDFDCSWACGGSCVADPRGRLVAGPVFDDRTVVYHDVDPDVRRLAKAEFDQLGHYARDDVFRLDVNREPFGQSR